MEFSKKKTDRKKEDFGQEIGNLFLETYRFSGSIGINQLNKYLDCCQKAFNVVKEGSRVYNGENSKYFPKGMIGLHSWKKDKEQTSDKFFAETLYEKIASENRKGNQLFGINSGLEDKIFEEILKSFDLE